MSNEILSRAQVEAQSEFVTTHMRHPEHYSFKIDPEVTALLATIEALAEAVNLLLPDVPAAEAGVMHEAELGPLREKGWLEPPE